MNPETTLVWHLLQGRLKDLATSCLLGGNRPPMWERIENVAGAGVPDLWYHWGGMSGWLELKQRGQFPAGELTPVAIESITAHQRLFWRRAQEAGACCHVLTRVANEWFLHTGAWAREHLGLVPAQALRNANLLGPPLHDFTDQGEPKAPEKALPQADVLLNLLLRSHVVAL